MRPEAANVADFGWIGAQAMPTRPRLLQAVCGAICLATAGLALADSFNGTYTGKKVLTKGDPAACAPREDSVSVTIGDNALTFTTSELKNYTIGFDPRPDGSFHQLLVDVNGATVDFRGRVVGSVLDADVTNIPCVHHWHLEKK
jgi:hypothetical protein